MPLKRSFLNYSDYRNYAILRLKSDDNNCIDFADYLAYDFIRPMIVSLLKYFEFWNDTNTEFAKRQDKNEIAVTHAYTKFENDKRRDENEIVVGRVERIRSYSYSSVSILEQ